MSDGQIALGQPSHGAGVKRIGSGATPPVFRGKPKSPRVRTEENSRHCFARMTAFGLVRRFYIAALGTGVAMLLALQLVGAAAVPLNEGSPPCNPISCNWLSA
jgi:hypothetical protein